MDSTDKNHSKVNIGWLSSIFQNHDVLVLHNTNKKFKVSSFRNKIVES